MMMLDNLNLQPAAIPSFDMCCATTRHAASPSSILDPNSRWIEQERTGMIPMARKLLGESGFSSLESKPIDADRAVNAPLIDPDGALAELARRTAMLDAISYAAAQI